MRVSYSVFYLLSPVFFLRAMAKDRGDGPVTLSVLDRLIDEEPRESAEAPLQRSKSLAKLKAALRRDLEWLLNSRQPVDPVPEDCPELLRSVYNYGLPDITSGNLISVDGRARLMRAVEAALTAFEPRLANVHVILNSTADDKSPRLRFTVEGMLRVDPSPEHVSFDTLLEVANGEYKVQG